MRSRRAGRIAGRPAPLAAPGTAQLQVGTEAGYRGGARDGRAVFQRLAGALQPDQPEVVQRRDAGVIDEQPQQVTLRSVTVTDTDYVREQDREFFIAYAQTQRRKTSEGALRKQVATDNHAPENYRADTVRNLDAWYDAFDVRPGQRLYLEPSVRVRVW